MTTSPSTPHQRSWSTLPGELFLVAVLSFVASFVALKFFFLVAFVLAAIVDIVRRRGLVIHLRLVTFFGLMAIAGTIWTIVGLFHPGNFVQGITDAARLYILWFGAYGVLYSLLRCAPSLRMLDRTMVAAGILIPLINFVGLTDTYLQLGLLPDGLRTTLNLNVAIKDGYIQITSMNIGSMFLVAPYLLTILLRSDADEGRSILTKLSLVLSLILVAASGRRALWLVVFMTPCVIIGLAGLTGAYRLIKAGGRRVLLAYTVAAVAALGLLVTLPEMPEESYVGHLQDAFGSTDERSIQRPFLVAGFLEAPMLGSGFGAAAEYLRDYERPWAGYELTYYQMLFNLGGVGMAYLGALVAVYFLLVIDLLRRFKARSAIPFSLLVAYVGMLVGASSNRYFGSFDLLLYVGLLPYLSTFRRGFDEQGTAAEALA